MATLKFKEIKNMTKEEREKKIMDLKMELIKSRANAAKSGSVKTKEIKKIIARLKTAEKAKQEK